MPNTNHMKHLICIYMTEELSINPLWFSSYLHVFFFVPPRAPCRAFKNHVMKSTASPAEQKTINEHCNLYRAAHVKSLLQICSTQHSPVLQSLAAETLPCLVIWKFFLLHRTTACSISCGDTWALKFLGFKSLRISSPNLCTKRNMMSPGGLRIPL